ncbi:amidophosphoribosyltransferase [Candidatus Daviesbacteria bacterium]|nr:amidophosphoribosyltransferase [Candidatus Daviesbacteria bacterium]
MYSDEPGICNSEDDLSEKCAIFGVYNGHSASREVYFGLYALQHRGQESSGIASTDGKKIHAHKSLGLVPQVYSEKDFDHLIGDIAIGHNRYSTSGGTLHQHNQPVHNPGDPLALAHNGNLPSTKALEIFLTKNGIGLKGLNDSELIYEAIKFEMGKGKSLADAVTETYHLFTGAFALLVMSKDELVALQDPYGIRPLSYGKLNGGYAFSSETCALDTVNATFLGDVAPGEMIVAGKNGLKKYHLARGERKLDIFEFVYFARPDSLLLGQRVYQVRQNFGKILAEEFPIKADVVIPVPESAIPAAIGYSMASGIQYQQGLIKNRYIGRTFIMPDQRLRDRSVQMKLIPVPEVLKDKRVIVIDDSIVRGTTTGKIVKMIRSAGAKEVHVIISSPPVKYPDFYGINTPFQKDLIAANKSVSEICEIIGADSLNYLSYEGLIRGTNLPEKIFNTSMFTGHYPLDIHERANGIKTVSL